MPDQVKLPGGHMLEPHIMLYVDGVTVSFDGFKALNSLSLILEEGELRTIIGPNGAGKTTMMDVITGKTRCQQGTVMFQGGVDLQAMDEATIARLGVGRKFQKPTVFEALTVRENLALALQGGETLWPLFRGGSTPGQRSRIDEIMELTGLVPVRDRRSGELSH